MSDISRNTRQELVVAVGERYRKAMKQEKSLILGEFVALTRYHRKHAIRILNRTATPVRPRKSGRCRIYDECVREALTTLWEASDRVCGKRLKPLLPLLVASLERHGHLHLDEAVRRRVLSASAATIDRILAGPRANLPGRRRDRTKPLVRSQVRVRTFGDWGDPEPGFTEIDLVSHCGGTATGSFAYTLTVTDIASGWTEGVPLLVREGSLVVDALDRLRSELPFSIKGFDSDNGSEFINDCLVQYCKGRGIEFTRSRPHRKNDQAWVEQKNGSVVRRLVGYGRLEGIAAVEALARLYGAARLFINFFQPSFKLASKERIGARVSKRYHPPETPCARLLASPSIPESTKQRLRAVLVTLDPLRLLDEIRTVQHHLAGLAAGEAIHVLPSRDADLDRFLRGLATAWKSGEVRPTHRKGPKPARHWRTHKDPFEACWPRILLWLESEPEQTAKQLLLRLQAEDPNSPGSRQLRTLQRRVKAWRKAAARRLLFGESGVLALPPNGCDPCEASG
jgi:hypothetical protein